MSESNYLPDPMPEPHEIPTIQGGCSGSSGSGSPFILTVSEVDGSPSVTSVTTLNVTNGTLTDNGSGSVTVVTGGGGVAALSGAGSPVGAVTPSAVNQFYRRTDVVELWQSTGLTNADWIQWI